MRRKLLESRLSLPFSGFPWSPAGLCCRRDRRIVVDDTADHTKFSLRPILPISVPLTSW